MNKIFHILLFYAFLIKKPLIIVRKLRAYKLKVVPPGIEPGTQGFSVLCSTN